MDLIALTEAEFLCEANLVHHAPAFISAQDFAPMLEGIDLGSLPVCRENNDWKIVRCSPTDTLLLTSKNELAGVYIGDALVINECARGQGLSVPLILFAVVERPLPNDRKVTDLGEKALRKAWQVANGLTPSPWWP